MMFAKELIGKWWAFKNSGDTGLNTVYAVQRSDCSPTGRGINLEAHKNSITAWYYPEALDINLIVSRDRYAARDFKGSDKTYSVSGISFPPSEYIEDGVTEFEILENGDYRIFDTIPFEDFVNLKRKD